MSQIDEEERIAEPDGAGAPTGTTMVPRPARVLVGAGGHAREVALICRRLTPPVRVLGVIADEDPRPDLLRSAGVDFLGPVVDHIPGGAEYVIAIGSCAARRHVESLLGAAGARWASSTIDPDSTIAEDVLHDHGLVVFPRSIISTNVRIGRHCHINSACVVSHDVSLGDFVTLSPGVLLNGTVSVGDCVFFGSGAIVLPGVSIGDGAVIGAGAVVTADVPALSTVIGVPARGSTPSQ